MGRIKIKLAAPVRTLGVGEKVSRLTLEQERVGVSVCKSDGAVLVEQGGTLLPVLKSCLIERVENLKFVVC